MQSGGGSPLAPAPAATTRGGLTHTFISLADSYTPTVRRSWRWAATSSSSTAVLTVCILGVGGKEAISIPPASAPQPLFPWEGAQPGHLLLRRVVARHDLFQRHVAVIIHSGKQEKDLNKNKIAKRKKVH